jgi:hypothetical protein
MDSGLLACAWPQNDGDWFCAHRQVLHGASAVTATFLASLVEAIEATSLTYPSSPRKADTRPQKVDQTIALRPPQSSSGLSQLQMSSSRH